MTKYLTPIAVFLGMSITLSSCSGCDDSSSGSDCEPGTAGCECRDGDAGPACDEGLTCVEGVCQGENTIGVSISDPNVRSCEVLVEEAGAVVVGLTTDGTIKGTFIRQAPKVAITFISLTDEPIGEDALQIRTTGDDSATITVKSSSCADSAGQPIDGATVSLSE